MPPTKFTIVVEQHADRFIAYPLGIVGCVVGQGETASEALADVQSAIRFHAETFGQDAVCGDAQLLDAYVTETVLAN